MIESQKQYEETLDFLKINRFAYDEANEIEDLIEALRKVARAAAELNDFVLKPMSFGGIPVANSRITDLQQALAALSDWIKEDG